MRQGHPKGCIGRGGVYSVAGPPACPSKSESLQAPYWQAQAEFVFKFEAERHEPACRSTANALLWLCPLLCLMFYFSPQQRFHTVQLKLNKMGSAGDAVCGRRSFRRRSIDHTEGHGSNKTNTTSCGGAMPISGPHISDVWRGKDAALWCDVRPY